MEEYNNPYIEQMENELIYEKNKNLQLVNAQGSLFNKPSEDNLIRFQLDLKEDLDKIYHLLRGDIIIEQDGEKKYIENPDDDLKPFNEYGTQIVMNIISFYMNRNTLLSNYSEDMINYKVLDFGKQIGDLILCKYNDMMLTTSFKKEFRKYFGFDCIETTTGDFGVYLKTTKGDIFYFITEDTKDKIKLKIAEHLQNKVELYPMIIEELKDSVHSSYLRALGQGERTSLREGRVVHENVGGSMNMNNNSQGQQQSKFKWFNPRTWA